jgi:hypothetical protein
MVTIITFTPTEQEPFKGLIRKRSHWTCALFPLFILFLSSLGRHRKRIDNASVQCEHKCCYRRGHPFVTWNDPASIVIFIMLVVFYPFVCLVLISGREQTVKKIEGLFKSKGKESTTTTSEYRTEMATATNLFYLLEILTVNHKKH